MARSKPGIPAVRGAWLDATAELARAEVTVDPPPDQQRGGIKPGQWAGSPADNLPPACPVLPLGVDGKTSYYIDTLGQMIDVSAGEWSPKLLLQLFAKTPNFLKWAWPRFDAKTFKINGLEVHEAMQCLVKAAADRGIFSPAEKVRGRGAWTLKSGALIWHAGDRVFAVQGGKLVAMKPGELDGIFYPQRPPTIVPWASSIPVDASPVHKLLQALRSWNWERSVLDPLLVIGWAGCAFVGGALDWRPHLYTTGDKGVGKSTLHFLLKGLLGSALHSTADTTPAGIYQRVKQDSLPCAIDELEATADNRRVMGVVSLARLASSGSVMYRGGAEHEGVEFALRNTFYMSGINPPPMEPADKSRLALLNLGKLDPNTARPDVLDVEFIGRVMLRTLMDRWAELPDELRFWKSALHKGGIDSRGQDTWGTLLAVASLLLGHDGLEAAGLPVTDEVRLGAFVAAATASQRAETMENWVDCLHRLYGGRIDAWKGGEQPTVGSALADWERNSLDLSSVNARLMLVGLAAQEREITDDMAAADLDLAARRDEGERKIKLLCVPIARSPGLERLFIGSKWSDGVWSSALKQAPKHVVIRNWGNGQNVKINRQAVRCLLIDLKAYDQVMRDDFGIDPDPGGDGKPAHSRDAAGDVAGGCAIRPEGKMAGERGEVSHGYPHAHG